MLQKAYFLAEVDFGTAENEPLKVCSVMFNIQAAPPPGGPRGGARGRPGRPPEPPRRRRYKPRFLASRRRPRPGRLRPQRQRAARSLRDRARAAPLRIPADEVLIFFRGGLNSRKFDCENSENFSR